MATDREVIFARRALFVASALAGLARPGKADPAPVEPTPSDCSPPRQPNPQERELAKQLYLEGRAKLDADDVASAVDAFRRAYELAPLPRLLVLLADAELKLGDLAAAERHLDELVRCATEPQLLTSAQTLREQLDAVSGRVTIEGGPPGSALQIDGKDAGTLPLDAPLRLAAGAHELALIGECEAQTRFELGAGETRTLELDPRCEPRVCLSPCLSPPPPPPPSSLPRFALGAGALNYVSPPRDAEPRILLGARVDVSYAAPLGNSLALQLGIAFLPAISDAGGLFPLGVDLAAVATAGPLRIGVGVTSGWLWSSVNDSDDSVRHPRSSVFVHPYLQPLGFRPSEHIEAGLHVGVMLSQWRGSDGDTFRPGFVTTGLWLRYYFGTVSENQDFARLRGTLGRRAP